MKCRILLVEDSATQAEALRVLLEQQDYEVSIAPTGEVALERLAEATFELVLSDIVMPGIDGFELCRRIKQNPHSHRVPVVLLTSLADPMDIVSGLECGADNYITKPYDPDHLLARVRHVMDNRSLRRDAKTTMGVTVRFMGRDLTINSEREQILDLFISSVEDVVRANEALQRRERELADAKAQLEVYATEKAREARISTERYGALLKNAGDAIIVLDVEGRVVEANELATHLLGGSLEQQSLEDLVAEDDREEIRQEFARLGQERQVNLGVRRFTEVTGEEIWCELTASLTPLDDDALVLLIARDVTERQKTEQRLYDTNQRLTALIEASPLAIVALDGEGRVELWNPTAERMFGWTEAEALQREPAPWENGREQEYGDLLRRALQGESLTGVETVRVRRDGTPVEVSLYAAPLRSADGQIIGCMGLLADITERKQAETALREREEVERANRAKSEFLSRMSHELRTPLNAILGFAQLLEMDELTEEQTDSVEQIVRGGRHLLDLINEVLDLSRIEAGKLPLSLEPVSVPALIRDVMGLIRPLATPGEIRLETEGIDASDVFVVADLQRLKQVVLNFLSNAVKYNRRQGMVSVEVSPVGEDRLRIVVRDTGEGLAPEQLARLFVPFERLEAEEGGIQGTGLGLVLAKGLAEAMGGEVGVESIVGEGSTFWIELPRVEAPRAVPATRSTDAYSLPPNPAPEGSFTVLYIEDNTSNIRLVERVLARPGMRLLTAMQGRLGLELAREHRPDLILLDLNLPDLQGEEVLRHLREHESLRDTPVVVISADALPGQATRLLNAGAQEYLTKPFDMKRFIQVVDECLRRGK